jgi:hypothetical protein
MKLPVAIASLLFATSVALPALAATHPSAPVEMVQYRPALRQDTNRLQPSGRRDDYNAHASAPSVPDATHAVRSRDTMPPGWKCVDRGGQDPSVFPSWQFCE